MRRIFGVAVAVATGVAIGSGPLAGCGGDSESVFEAGAPSSSGVDDPGLGGGGFTPGTPNEASTTCEDGKGCGDGGVCAGGTCCEAALACGPTCCGGGQVCSFQKCVTPGAVCRDSSECGPGNYCEFTLGTKTNPDGGAGDGGDGGMCVVGVDVTGKCLPRPPECAPDAGTGTGGALTCLEKCEYRPPVPTFSTVLKAAWGQDLVSPYTTEVMMAPIVVQLTDDDCDGKLTERDIPEIVFSTFTIPGGYEVNGVTRAISIVNGAFVDVWSIPNAGNATALNPTKHLAGGNFDGQPGNEIVGCGQDGRVKALRGTDGAFLWSSVNTMACHMPAIADLDGDGNVEIIVEGGILNGADGTLKYAYSEPLIGNFVVSDIDGDGKLDVVTATKAYNASGVKFADTALGGVACLGAGSPFCAAFPDDADSKGPFVGIGDFDLDGKPEVVAVDNWNHAVAVWRYDAAAASKATVVRTAVDMNQLFPTNPCTGWGATHGGGPPTVADFDKDGVPDVGLAGGIGYVVFNGKRLVDPVNFTGAQSILWSQSTTDCSSASTGSTVFDFDGDGKAEVVYSDENRMRIYEGATGNVLATFCNTTATLSEFPLVADVDNDGHADIVIAANAYSRTCTEPGGGPATRQGGIRVFGDTNGSWVRTRRVWNQHSYHVTNVNEDGSIPKNEAPNWAQPGLNNFRQNKQPGSEFAAPNLVVRLSPICPTLSGVRITVQNVGQALVPAGVVVGVYSGTPGAGVKIGSVTTTRVLYPAESELLELAIPAPAPGSVYAIADDGAPPHPSWNECRTDDNTSRAIAFTCTSPN